MNPFDLIGKLVISIYGAFLVFSKEAIELVDSLMGSVKKKALKSAQPASRNYLYPKYLQW